MKSPSLRFFLCLFPVLSYFEERSASQLNYTPRNALISLRLTNGGLRMEGVCLLKKNHLSFLKR